MKEVFIIVAWRFGTVIPRRHAFFIPLFCAALYSRFGAIPGKSGCVALRLFNFNAGRTGGIPCNHNITEFNACNQYTGLMQRGIIRAESFEYKKVGTANYIMVYSQPHHHKNTFVSVVISEKKSNFAA